MATEYKQKNDSIINLYTILGLSIDVCKEPNCDKIIHKAYVKKAKVCHPDKHPDKKDVAEELFELLTRAYDVLKDDKTRGEYNHKLSINKQSSNDYHKLKQGATDYSKTIGEYVPPTDEQMLSFEQQMRDVDTKQGYDRNEAQAIPSEKAVRKMKDMTNIRSTQDRDLKPEKLFDDGRFDIKKFNAAFDMVHNKEHDAMVPHNGVPSAWNDLGTPANYSSFDNLDNIYVEDGSRYDTSRQTYGGVDFALPQKKITKDDMLNIRAADYVDGHNKISEDYYRDMKTKLRDRSSDQTNFESMKYGDFKRDDMAGYGIFDQIGFKFDDRLALDVDDDDISKKLEKLMAERQQQNLSISINQKPVPNSTRQSRQRGAR